MPGKLHIISRVFATTSATLQNADAAALKIAARMRARMRKHQGCTAALPTLHLRASAQYFYIELKIFLPFYGN